ncbi:MAG: hypothetical protein ACYC8T_21320 [Myxococcaceae bacterium]
MIGFFTLAAAVALAAPGPLPVLPADDTGTSLAAARSVAAAITASGREAGVAPPADASRICLAMAASPARRECFARAGHPRLLVVAAIELRDRLALTVEVLDGDGATLGEGGVKGARSELDALASDLSSRLTPLWAAPREDPKPPSDAPVSEAPRPLVLPPVEHPRVSPTPVVVVTPEAPPRSRTPAWIATGVAAAAAGVAMVFAAEGLAGKGRLESSTGGVSALRRSEAQALKGRANNALTVSAIAGGGAVGVGALAVFLWSTGP